MYLTVLFFGGLVLLFLLVGSKKPAKFPPGPRWYPIVGCALQLARLRERCGMLCKVVDELAKHYINPYGVYGLKIGKDRMVVAYYSDSIVEMASNEDLDGRPDDLFYRLRTFNKRLGILVTDEDLWLDQRRFIFRHLKEFGYARSGMSSNIHREAEHLLADLQQCVRSQGGRRATVHMQNLFTVYVLNTSWYMLSSKRHGRQGQVDELLAMFFDLLQNIDMVGALFSQFPLVRFVAPDYSGYTAYVENHRRFYAFLQREVDEHRKTFRNYDEPRDLIDTYLREMASDSCSPHCSEEQLMAVCLDFFLAGSETTNKSTGFAFLHMVLHPEIQDRAYEEIREAVGLERLPLWSDRAQLPYCEGIVLEAVRMFMGHTFGVPHRALRDTRLCGYNVPRGTTVVACFRGALMNPHDFPQPTKFMPERYLVDGKVHVPAVYTPFGLGRHRCMGEQLGRQTLFVFIATMLQNFRVEPVPGQPPPSEELLDGVTAAVRPYDAVLVPRNGALL